MIQALTPLVLTYVLTPFVVIVLKGDLINFWSEFKFSDGKLQEDPVQMR